MRKVLGFFLEQSAWGGLFEFEIDALFIIKDYCAVAGSFKSEKESIKLLRNREIKFWQKIFVEQEN